jgi:hypothetical protein
LAIAIIAAVGGLLAGIIAVAFSLVASSIAIAAAGVFSFVNGFIEMAASPAAGIFYIGGGLAMAAFGVAIFYLTIVLFKLAVKGVAWLINKWRRRIEKKKNIQGKRVTVQEAPPADTETAAAETDEMQDKNGQNAIIAGKAKQSTVLNGGKDE